MKVHTRPRLSGEASALLGAILGAVEGGDDVSVLLRPLVTVAATRLASAERKVACDSGVVCSVAAWPYGSVVVEGDGGVALQQRPLVDSIATRLATAERKAQFSTSVVWGSEIVC
jgi:hypothetical protein